MHGRTLLLLLGLLVAVVPLGIRQADASHDLFRYKFPCNPSDACYVTTLAHVGNALDFDVVLGARGEIRAVSEGTFIGYFSEGDECTSFGIGMYAVINDIHGRSLRYGHLSSFGGLQNGQRVMQGDLVGIEGNTGYAENCADHLHLEGIATAPGIDGIPMASLGLGSYSSTNYVVGAFSTRGLAIRNKYIALGVPFTSWATVGWTTGIVVEHPNALTGHWGSIQGFKLHPDGSGFDTDLIGAGRWQNNTAYWIRPPYWASWFSAARLATHPSTSRWAYRSWTSSGMFPHCAMSGSAPLTSVFTLVTSTTVLRWEECRNSVRTSGRISPIRTTPSLLRTFPWLPRALAQSTLTLCMMPGSTSTATES